MCVIVPANCSDASCVWRQAHVKASSDSGIRLLQKKIRRLEVSYHLLISCQCHQLLANAARHNITLLLLIWQSRVRIASIKANLCNNDRTALRFGQGKAEKEMKEQRRQLCTQHKLIASQAKKVDELTRTVKEVQLHTYIICH